MYIYNVFDRVIKYLEVILTKIKQFKQEPMGCFTCASLASGVVDKLFYPIIHPFDDGFAYIKHLMMLFARKKRLL